MPGVVQYVHESNPHFARRSELSRVIAVGEDGARSRPQPVQSSRDAHEEALHPARQRVSIGGLGDQMEVVRLQRVLVEPEAEAFAPRAERALDRDASGVSSQARQARAQPHGDVDGMPGGERLPRTVRHAGPRTGALPAGAGPRSSPRAELELALAQAMSTTTHEKGASALQTCPGRSNGGQFQEKLGSSEDESLEACIRDSVAVRAEQL